jgi:hypothetical protein
VLPDRSGLQRHLLSNGPNLCQRPVLSNPASLQRQDDLLPAGDHLRREQDRLLPQPAGLRRCLLPGRPALRSEQQHLLRKLAAL